MKGKMAGSAPWLDIHKWDVSIRNGSIGRIEFVAVNFVGTQVRYEHEVVVRRHDGRVHVGLFLTGRINAAAQMAARARAGSQEAVIKDGHDDKVAFVIIGDEGPLSALPNADMTRPVAVRWTFIKES